jgi:hypothetical protein
VIRSNSLVYGLPILGNAGVWTGLNIGKMSNKEAVITFMEWLRYDDEMLEAFIANKIPPLTIYNRFIDETKLM